MLILVLKSIGLLHFAQPGTQHLGTASWEGTSVINRNRLYAQTSVKQIPLSVWTPAPSANTLVVVMSQLPKSCANTFVNFCPLIRVQAYMTYAVFACSFIWHSSTDIV